MGTRRVSLWKKVCCFSEQTSLDDGHQGGKKVRKKNPITSAISTLAPSIVPMIREPFIANFMLDVPDASVPAVEMCWLSSAPGIITSASETL